MEAKTGGQEVRVEPDSDNKEQLTKYQVTFPMNNMMLAKFALGIAIIESIIHEGFLNIKYG